MNRSYYAMFYCVLALLQTINKTPRKHQGAISFFDREFVYSGFLPEELSFDLHRIFELRQVDDYKKIDPVGLDEAQEAIAVAERFLTAIKEYPATGGYLPGEERPWGKLPLLFLYSPPVVESRQTAERPPYVGQGLRLVHRRVDTKDLQEVRR